MNLKLGNFCVKDIQFGDRTAYAGGILTINKEEAIAVLNKEGKLKNIEMHIARPGENVRLIPVKSVVEPRFRPDGRSAFPGYTGPAAPAGEGITYALKNMSVLGVGRNCYGGMNGIIDMSGPGAEPTYLSQLIHLLFVADNADPDENTVKGDNINFVKASHYLAEYLAATTKDQQPCQWENLVWDKVDSSLPRVAFMCQQCNIPNWTRGISYYGYDTERLPTLMVKPLECLDGAITGDCGSLCVNTTRYTYDFLNAPIIKRLLAEHGKTLNFVGVVFTGHIEPIDQKKQYAQIIVSMATSLELDAAIYMQSHCGNVDVDYMLTMAGLEDAGIKTVGVLVENNGRDGRNPGKTYADPKANAIVSTGNTCEVYELPPMETVYGDLNCIGRDLLWGAWHSDAVYGPSRREDGSLVIDAHMFLGHDGLLGTSNKVVLDF